jgi:hypothetical protein
MRRKSYVHGEGQRYAAKAAGAILTKRAHRRHLTDTRGNAGHLPIVHHRYKIFSLRAFCHIVLAAQPKSNRNAASR